MRRRRYRVAIVAQRAPRHVRAAGNPCRYANRSVEWTVLAIITDVGVREQNGPLAQLAEQQTLNLRVEGSIPSRLTIPNKALTPFSTDS